jgi:hypothetical protein
MRVGERLAREGALGRFAVDFVVERDGESDDWAAYAIEVNLPVRHGLHFDQSRQTGSCCTCSAR